MSENLDRWMSANLRNEIEQRFYAKISEQADFNRLAREPDFMAAPNKHVGLYADHGISHARDVASQIVTVLRNAHGVLIPSRNSQRFAFMQGYGVLLAYLHDIGMVDFSRFGRVMHPEYAAQAVFDPLLGDLIDAFWRENSGGVAWRLRTLADQGLLNRDPRLILRELLALSVCHSKSKIPMELLNDPHLLRAQMLEIIASDLRALYDKQQGRSGSATGEASAPQGTSPRNPHIDPYPRFQEEGFCWLVARDAPLEWLVEDVIDTLRALRVADALRQRGTVLITSANYQIFVDQNRGSAIYALRLGEDQLYLLEMDDPISAGEANIASSELEPSGDLRISFHHGFFNKPEITELATHHAAIVVNDIQKDVIKSFARPIVEPGLKQAADMLILLETTDDNLSFVQMVKKALQLLDPEVAQCVHATPSLKYAHPLERERYLAAKPLEWSLQRRCDLIAHMIQTGYPAQRIDTEQAFKDVRLAVLEAGDVLLEAKANPSFVYLPLGPGLKIIPLGGYQSFSVEPWMFLGMAGVIRNAERNATIVAERNLQVLIIPKTTYLEYWHHTLSLEEFQGVVAEAVQKGGAGPGSLSHLEKTLTLQMVPLLKMVDQQTLTDLAGRVTEIGIPAGQLLFAKGSIGRSLFVVVKGTLRVHDEALILAHIGPGEVVGEMAALTPEARTASVTAIEDSILLRLSQCDLNDLVDHNPSVARGLIEVLAGYVRERMAGLGRRYEPPAA